MRRAYPYRGENHGPGKEVQGELDLTPGIREQPGSFSHLDARDAEVRFTPTNGLGEPARSGPKSHQQTFLKHM